MTTTQAEEETTEAPVMNLGVERWVQFGFIASALLAFWILDNVIVAVWDIFQEPDPNIASGAAVVLAGIGAFVLYRRPNVHAFVNDVCVELSRVTWPTRKEAWSHTLVVLVVSFIAAVILGVFDAAWSALSDFIYTV